MSQSTAITIQRADRLRDSDRAEIHDFLIAVFQPSPDEVYAETDYYVRVWREGQFVSLVEVFDRTITVGGAPLRVGGIGGVSTHPEWRGRGFSTAALLEAARFLFDELGVSFGVLICGEDMIPFYARLGWQVIDAPVFVQTTRQDRERFADITMILPRAGQSWPPGEVDFCGPPW